MKTILLCRLKQYSGIFCRHFTAKCCIFELHEYLEMPLVFTCANITPLSSFEIAANNRVEVNQCGTVCVKSL